MPTSAFIHTVQAVRESRDISEADLEILLNGDAEEREYLYHTARELTDVVFGKNIYLRGLIEFSNFCKNNCLYCGIRRDNHALSRYRLSEEEILVCADTGYELGFRTIVLQSGEDLSYTDDVICRIIRGIKAHHPDVAVTLSIGEKDTASYRAYREAGADRYLLRHETADRDHYRYLHILPDAVTGEGEPPGAVMSYDNRMRCLRDLRELGFQVGCGFMVGSPGQDLHCLYEDLQFIRRFHPHMVGIGPFLSQHDTPFAYEKNGTAEMTLTLLSLLRLLDPKLLLPATTALGTVHPQGRERGILAGANVVMPNLSPVEVRDKYTLYDNKICTGEEAAECIRCLTRRIESLGYEVVPDRGDHPDVGAPGRG